jgi:membrane-bound lytic murein transglycosylase B
VSQQDLDEIYRDPRMPESTFVPFSVRPKEPASMYSQFTKPSYRELGASFLQSKKESFDKVEQTLQVPREVVAAILVVESQVGRYTGNQLIVYRLSRLASTNAPDNLRENYLFQKKKDKTVTFDQVQRRGRYLEQTFLPEIPALITIAKQTKIDIMSIKGSVAGAFGMPQFLPSAFMKFGMDGNKDGNISLHNDEDALWSTANYLANYGFRGDIPLQEKRSIIWRYNKSKSYIDTILRLSTDMKEQTRKDPNDLD